VPVFARRSHANRKRRAGEQPASLRWLDAQASNLQACGGCDARLARRRGAQLAITGTVQKVSNLIFNLSIYVRDASSGVTIAAMSADMRGNTDESWTRTLNWLVRNRLLAPGYGLQR
jgi:hypothetical protein